MTNDTSTLSGALLEMKDQLIYELGQKGVTATYSSSTGLLGLIAKIGDIQTGGGGSCYHIEFEQSSYIAVGGSATVSVYLQSNYAPLSGATVSITGSDGSSYTCITNSEGVGTCTVSGLSSSTQFTASYSNVSDTASVTPRVYYLNDDASSDNSSTLFGTYDALRNSGSNTAAWNSSGYYTVKTHSSGQRESFRVLAPLTGITTDMVIEWDGYSEQTSGTDGLVIYNSSTAWEKLSDNVDTSKQCWYGYNDGSFHETLDHMSQVTYQRWCHYKYTIIGKQFTVEVTYNGSTVWERTETLHFDRSSSTMYGFNSEWEANRTTRYKNIQAYSI